MSVLVDTNVLLRILQPDDLRHRAARSAVRDLRLAGASLFTTSQNLIETWNVVTRPQDKNGLGYTPDMADRFIRRLENGFPRLRDPSGTYVQWRRLVVRFAVSGVQVHDARLVAVMLGAGISEILTFNTRDFRRYAALGIKGLDPEDIESTYLTNV